MARNQMVTIGIKGETPTTHCLITGRPLGDAPINYSLADNYYVSVNHGNALTPQQIEQISGELLPHFEVVEIDEIEIEEIDYDD